MCSTCMVIGTCVRCVDLIFVISICRYFKFMEVDDLLPVLNNYVGNSLVT